MGRPKSNKRKIAICAEVDGFIYDYLKKQADKHGYSIAETVRRVLAFFIERQFGSTIVVSLEEEQEKRLNEIAKTKGISVGELTSRIVASYLEV